jgi:hypothetical protein
MTLSEIPRIANTGMETGINPGFSTTIYKGMNDLLESTVSVRQTSNSSIKFLIFNCYDDIYGRYLQICRIRLSMEGFCGSEIHPERSESSSSSNRCFEQLGKV